MTRAKGINGDAVAAVLEPWRGMRVPWQRLADIANARLGVRMTRGAVRHILVRRGWGEEREDGRPPVMTDAQMAEAARLRAEGLPWRVVAERLGGGLSDWQVASALHYRGFAPKVPRRGRDLPVGTLRLGRWDGWRVKVAEPNVWRSLARVVWERERGPIPDGMRVAFLDGDSANCALENLALVTRHEHNVMAARRLYTGDAELTRLGVAAARLSARAAEVGGKTAEKEREAGQC